VPFCFDLGQGKTAEDEGMRKEASALKSTTIHATIKKEE
jgi:hypothetical protein